MSFSPEQKEEFFMPLDEHASLTRLNALDKEAARQQFLRCCGAQRWARKMAAARPFKNASVLNKASDAAFELLKEADWLEAFAQHPEIGDIESLRERFSQIGHWAGTEQSGTGAASEATLRALSEGNRLYREKFGFIFIIRATGKSADEMLADLNARLPNDYETEVRNAAEQQIQITRLRLRKMLAI